MGVWRIQSGDKKSELDPETPKMSLKMTPKKGVSGTAR